MTFLGVRHPRSTRLNQADLSDAPAHEITSPALSNQGAGPMKPAVGQVKWLVAALAIRRSHCQRYARPLHPTTQTWSDRELRPHQAKPSPSKARRQSASQGRPSAHQATRGRLPDPLSIAPPWPCSPPARGRAAYRVHLQRDADAHHLGSTSLSRGHRRAARLGPTLSRSQRSTRSPRRQCPFSKVRGGDNPDRVQRQEGGTP